MNTSVERLGRPPARRDLVDLGVGLLVTVVGLAEILLPFSSRAGDGSAAVSCIGVLVAGCCVAVRRHFPLGALVALFATFALLWLGRGLLGAPYVLFFGQLVPIGILVYSVARNGRGRVPFVGAGITALFLLLGDLTIPALQEPSEIVFHWGVMTILWSFGFGLSRYAAYALSSARRVVEAEAETERQALAAAEAERTRIARDLHDVVAHAMSSMIVQAGAARQVVRDDPAFVERALDSMRTTGVGALDELRRLVFMLRTSETDDPLAAQPGLERVPGLLADLREAGWETDQEIAGAPRPLPAGVDLAAYRIVQEALSNVRRHAAATRVSVRIDYRPDSLTVEVADDGRDPTPEAASAGHGLIGMRERTALYGGSLQAGPTGAGFIVRAKLPLAPAEAPR